MEVQMQETQMPNRACRQYTDLFDRVSGIEYNDYESAFMNLRTPGIRWYARKICGKDLYG